MIDDMHINGNGIEPEPGPDPRDENVEVCRRFLRQLCSPSDDSTHGSYGLKHIVERWAPTTGYVSNGALIQAADELGYQYDIRGSGPNVDIYLEADGFCQIKREERGIEEMYRVLEQFVEDSQSILNMLSRPGSFQNSGKVHGERALLRSSEAARSLADALDGFVARRSAAVGKLYECKEEALFTVREDGHLFTFGPFQSRTSLHVQPGDYVWYNSKARTIAGLQHDRGLRLLWLKRSIHEAEEVIEERFTDPVQTEDHELRFTQEGCAWRAEVDGDCIIPPADTAPYQNLDELCDEVEAQLD